MTGALAVAILVVNNTRDHATDRVAGRRTLPARFGKWAGLVELAGCFGLAYVGTLGMVATGAAPPAVLGSLVTVPLAGYIVALVARHDDGPTLNRALARTGQLLLLHSVLVSGLLLVAGTPR